VSSVHFLLQGGNQNIESISSSNLASMRLRIGPAIRGLMDYEVKITFGEIILDSPDKVVITKIGGNNIQIRQKQWLHQIELAKLSGAKIFMDYTDHHLGFDSNMTGFYKNVLSMVDIAITSSKKMQQNLTQFFSGSINLIEDAIEVPTQDVKPSNKPTTLLWFGHASNIDSLINFIQQDFETDNQIRLIILSNEDGLQYFSKFKFTFKTEIEIQFGIWSLDMMIRASRLSDACILPINNFDPKKNGASSNRLITGLALGLPVAAGNLDSYTEFKKYYVDINTPEFDDLLREPSIFHYQVKSAQIEVVPRFSIENIKSEWLRLLK
jgi:hypothetical protein